VAAPLVLLRSEASVAAAQGMWDPYVDNGNKIALTSAKGIAVVILTVLTALGIVWFLSIVWAVQYDGWPLFWWAILAIILYWHIGLSAAVSAIGMSAISPITKLAGKATRATSFPRKAAGIIVMLVVAPGFAIGHWLRSIFIRISSVLRNIVEGFHNLPENWRRTMLVEDTTYAPEILPGVSQIGSTFKFDGILKRIYTGSMNEKFLGIFVTLFLYIPALLWRYSLKSTVWFYVPLIYVARRGKFGEPARRRLMIDRSQPPLEWLGAVVAATMLICAILALVDWFAVFGQMQHIEVLGPFGWLLVFELSELWDQPWQIPNILSAILTLVIFFWIGSLRSSRKQLIKTGEDPETAMDRAFSTERHPGLTLYYLNRLRTVLVVVSLVIGFWYFAKGSYEAGYLTPLDPFLGSIFGTRS